ncbi:hypothetical protein HMSSN139_48530 [Paenibacillus sp. HMSSN-139]|nr:hypothetical protein HMSSN139_48530 [Paenibacillus sp. HMSSN-139]
MKQLVHKLYARRELSKDELVYLLGHMDAETRGELFRFAPSETGTGLRGQSVYARLDRIFELLPAELPVLRAAGR